MKIREVSPTWFLGIARGAVFAGYSREEVVQKYWAWLQERRPLSEQIRERIKRHDEQRG